METVTGARWPGAARVAALAGAACLLTACGVKQETVRPPAVRPYSVTAILAPGATAALMTAILDGHLRDAGLAVAVDHAASGTQALKALAAGSTDMVVAGQSQLLLARDQGMHLVSIAALGRQPLEAGIQQASTGAEGQELALARHAGSGGVPADEYIVAAVRVASAEHDGEDLRAFMQALTEADRTMHANPAAAAALLTGPATSSATKRPTPSASKSAAHGARGGGAKHGAKAKAAAAAAAAAAKPAAQVAAEAAAQAASRARARAQRAAVEREISESPVPTQAEPYGYQRPASWETFARWMYVSGLLHTDPTSLSQPYTDEYLTAQGF
jgi:hypothetical protein